MGSECLALALLGQARTVSVGGLLFAILNIVVGVGLLILIIVGLIRLVRFLGTANKEMQRMRMEVGKLAEEIHLLREASEVGLKRSSETKPE